MDVEIQFKLAEKTSIPGYSEMKVKGSNDVFFVSPDILLDNRHIISAEPVEVVGRPGIMLILTEEGKTIFAEITNDNVGKNLGMIINGQLRSAPMIKAQISEGKAIIAGFFDKDEADRIIDGVNR